MSRGRNTRQAALLSDNRALTMHAFDFILVLLSFVYAAAVTQPSAF
jgi:hypothetical protein